MMSSYSPDIIMTVCTAYGEIGYEGLGVCCLRTGISASLSSVGVLRRFRVKFVLSVKGCEATVSAVCNMDLLQQQKRSTPRKP